MLEPQLGQLAQHPLPNTETNAMAGDDGPKLDSWFPLEATL
jgi:hypothetical protein